MMAIKEVVLAAALAAGLGSNAIAQSYGAGGVNYDDQPHAGEMLADVAIVRPLTLGVSAIGLVAWVVSLPFSIPGGNMEESAETWVSAPLKYTFMRPLGEMEEGAIPHYERDTTN